MPSLTGTGRLVRLTARLERVRLSIWVVSIGLMPLLVGSAFAELYPDPAERAQLADTLASAPALTAILGPLNGTSVGALTAWRIGTVAATLVAFMAAFTVIRHTRADEEEGRGELLGSTGIGRHAPLAAAVVVACGAGAAIGGLTVAGLLALGEAASGAVAFGVTFLLTAAAFAGVGAVTAQLASSASAARGLTSAVVGILFVLRMAGDGAGDGGPAWLSWVTPIGWGTKMAPFGAERWWVALLLGGFGIVALLGAVVLAGHRDVGNGVVQPRPGPAVAAPGLGSVSGLARRLHTRSLFAWTAAMIGFAAVWGVLAETINDLLDDNPQLAQIFEALGGTGRLTDAFFGAAFGIIALVVAAYAIGVVLRLRREETGQRAEPVLATPTSRLGWAASHLVFAFGAPVLFLSVAAVVAATVYGVTIGDVGSTAFSAVDTALVQLPAIWLTAGLAVTLFGLLPEQSGLAWGLLVAFLLLGQLGEILQLPQWAMNLSPFTHVPSPPAAITATPLVTMTAVAAALTGVGLAGLRRRDIG